MRACNSGIRRAAFFSNGLTLAELVTAMAIAALVLGLGIPSLQSFFIEHRLNSSADAMVAAVNLARSEAVRRGAGSRVTIVPNRDADWASGWTVFRDATPDANGGRAPGPENPATVAYFGPLASGVSVQEKEGMDQVRRGQLSYLSFVGSGQTSMADADSGTARNGMRSTSLEFEMRQRARCVDVLASGHAEATDGRCDS